MFGDDSFMGIEDLFNQLTNARQHSRSNRIQNQSLLGTVESKKETILIFDLSGRKVVSVEIREGEEVNDYGERINSSQKAVAIKYQSNEIIKYNIPKTLAKRKLNHTFRNGILEVSLKK